MTQPSPPLQQASVDLGHAFLRIRALRRKSFRSSMPSMSSISKNRSPLHGISLKRQKIDAR
jgi:hypothetical protein